MAKVKTSKASAEAEKVKTLKASAEDIENIRNTIKELRELLDDVAYDFDIILDNIGDLAVKITETTDGSLDKLQGIIQRIDK